ncbi:hypothetical protein KKE54_07525, partial [bacterium]|nr:hypothetical protein [bacterium]
MNSFLIFCSLLLSSALYAQQTLHETRVEENLFIMKIVAFVVLFLAALPFLLRKLDARLKQPVPQNSRIDEEFSETDAADLSSADEKEHQVEQKDIDPVDSVLEALYIEHNIPEEQRANYDGLYRRYLEVQTGRATAKTGSFDINTVFEDVTNRIHAIAIERNFELIFNIDASVPPQVIGDAERMTDTLLFVLHNIIAKSDTHLVELQIKRLSINGNAVHLEIFIPYGKDNYQKENLNVFMPYGEGISPLGLELYLAREYARLMHGDVTLVLCKDNDTAFVIDFKLYMTNPSEMRHYRLPSKNMIGHSVLLVDDHVESALAVKNMFVYFKNEVDLLSSKELFSALEMLEDYDIIVIQERYFSYRLIEKVKEIKST